MRPCVQMQAEINLLARALQDPLAQRFALLSESCVPMFPADAVWLQMLAQPRSRVNACLDWQNQRDVDQAMTYRRARPRAGMRARLRACCRSGDWHAARGTQAQHGGHGSGLHKLSWPKLCLAFT